MQDLLNALGGVVVPAGPHTGETETMPRSQVSDHCMGCHLLVGGALGSSHIVESVCHFLGKLDAYLAHVLMIPGANARDRTCAGSAFGAVELWVAAVQTTSSAATERGQE